MKLEVIATTVTDVIQAEKGGADRIELITGIAEGGLTPSLGLVEQSLKAASIPVYVMVRPHSTSFNYDQYDEATMIADIRAIRELGAKGIVMGMLTPDGLIDEAMLQTLLAECGDMAVTFHRAFDEIKDQEQALRTLSRYPQVKRVLTSGGQPSVLDAVEQLRKLNELGQELGIHILAGSGLTLPSLSSFIQSTGVREVHLGSSVRHEFKGTQPLNAQLVKQAADIVASHRRG